MVLTHEQAQDIYEGFIENGYVKRDALTEKYHADVENNAFIAPGGFKPEDILGLIDTIYKPAVPDNARETTVELKFDEEKFHRKEFQALWRQINNLLQIKGDSGLPEPQKLDHFM